MNDLHRIKKFLTFKHFKAMNNVLDIMHKKELSMMLYVDEHGREQKRTALEWVSFVKSITHVNKIVVIEQLNSKIKGEF